MHVVIAVAVVMTALGWLARVFVRVLAVLFDDELRGGNAGAQYSRRRDPGAVDGKAAERAAQLLERQAGIEQRAQHHVARRAVEAVKIQNPGHGYPLPSTLFPLLYQSASVIVYLLPGS